LLGGIGAEELIYRETSTGAQNDLQRATEIARRMVTEFGMSPKLGRVHYSETRSNPFGAAGGMSGEFQHSEDTIREIDLEVRRIIDESMSGVRELLHTRVAVLEHMTKDLMEVETMDAPHLNRILDEHKTETGPQIKPGTFATKATVTDTDEPKADENEPPLEAADGA
jgi:cell division protease FtsH